MKNKFLLPPNLLYGSAILAIILYFVFPRFNLVEFPHNLIGLIFMATGAGLNIIAWQKFMRVGTSERFEKSKKLVTDGVYRYSRNPMYVGGILILAGLAIFLGNILAFISPILFFLVIDRVVIPIEDEKTAGDLGEEYMEYKKRVREWI